MWNNYCYNVIKIATRSRCGHWILSLSHSLSSVYFTFIHWKLKVSFYSLPLHSKSVIVLDNLESAWLTFCYHLQFFNFVISSDLSFMSLPALASIIAFPTACRHSTVSAHLLSFLISHILTPFYPFQLTLDYFLPYLCLRFHWQSLADVFNPLHCQFLRICLGKFHFKCLLSLPFKLYKIVFSYVSWFKYSYQP